MSKENGLSRRSFVATATAAVASPLLPVASARTVASDPAASLVPVPQAAQQPPSFGYLTYLEYSDGEAPFAFSGKPNRSDRVFHASRVERFRFVPLDTPKRYEVVCAKWYEKFGCEWDWMDRSRRGKDFLTCDPQPELCPGLPTSLVQLPAVLGFGCELKDCESVGRADGFMTVAEYNRDALRDDPEDIRDWWVLVELGEPPAEVDYAHYSIDKQGVGAVTRSIHAPVRVVIPTADELAQYAIAEGGAA